MSSTMGPNARLHRVSEIKECENQSKFVNQRVHEIETFFGNLCSELVSYTRRTSKLRNNGDEIARILLDYSNKEQINHTTSNALRKVSEYFVTLEDYRNTEIDRIVGKVVNPLAAYGEEIKHIKNSLKAESAARRREIINMRKLERSNTIQSSREAEIQLHNAMIDATRSANNLERCVLDFEGRRLKGLKRIITDFIQIEMLWHAKALETLTSAYNAIQLLHEEADLIEFRGTLLRSGSNLTVLNTNNNLPISQQSLTIGDQSSPMISPPVSIRDHRSYRPSSSVHSSMNSMKTGSRCSLTSLGRNKKKNQQLQGQTQQQQQHDQLSYSQQLHQQRQNSGISHHNDDVTSLFTEGDDDVDSNHNVRDKVDNGNTVNGLQDLEDDDDDEDFEEEDNTENDDDSEEDEDGEYMIDNTNRSPTRIFNNSVSSPAANRISGSTQHSPLKSALKTGISKL
ncbi:unnamed protein product [Schistosoma rodhaini]|uniref:BAR domain-containing protein n=1 Tax=Schistosoma rodhaini TaxID=6188 RepID=A0AA85GCP2_9TREM|nr:unnamed protein product [Schistosoma rodhaini]